jgi:hypothetical protein
MVAEMAAILSFDLGRIQLNRAPLDGEKQRALFGSAFEKLTQERRVAVLAAYGMIDQTLKAAFDLIRTKRRRYLHVWSADHASLESDAIECFKAAVLVVVSALGLSVDNGKLILRQKVIEYLPNIVLAQRYWQPTMANPMRSRRLAEGPDRLAGGPRGREGPNAYTTGLARPRRGSGLLLNVYVPGVSPPVCRRDG